MRGPSAGRRPAGASAGRRSGSAQLEIWRRNCWVEPAGCGCWLAGMAMVSGERVAVAAGDGDGRQREGGGRPRPQGDRGLRRAAPGAGRRRRRCPAGRRAPVSVTATPVSTTVPQLVTVAVALTDAGRRQHGRRARPATVDWALRMHAGDAPTRAAPAAHRRRVRGRRR